jgi:hypothetical protein
VTARAVVAVCVLVACADPAAPTPNDLVEIPQPPASTSTIVTTIAPVPLVGEPRVVPLPAEVTGVRFPWFTADGSAILFSARSGAAMRDDIHAVTEDGYDLRCITCALQPDDPRPLLKPLPFSDGRRAIVRVGEQSPVRAAAHAVLECGESLLACDAPMLVPIVIPSGGASAVLQDQREFRIAPDGATVGFTQVLASPSGDPQFAAIVGRLVREPDHFRVDDPRVVSTIGELKDFTPDGRSVLVASFGSSPYAANPDVVRVDLDDGATTWVTSSPDYDEPLELSPDQQSYVVGSGRGSGLFETVSRIRRPNLIGPGLEPLVAALFTQHRPELLQPWLVQGDEDAGLQLNPGSLAEGFFARAIANWHPDGDRIVFSEDPIGTPQPGAIADRAATTASRIIVVEVAQSTGEPVERRRGSPRPRWATPLAQHVAADVEPASSRAGALGGSVTVTMSPSTADPAVTIVEVRYDAFSDEAGWIIDGIERAEFQGGIVGTSTYTADLVVGGDHTGWLRADATLSPGGIEGTIASSLDGVEMSLHRPSG